MDKILKLALEVQDVFKDFYLAGGTSIMIKYKHRISEDLDFFKEKLFSFNRLYKKVHDNFKVDKWEKGEDNIDFFIHGIKVSFVFFPFKNVEKVEPVKKIVMASDMDIFLNKIYASGRRIEQKDPYDAAYLYKIHQWDKNRIKELFEKNLMVRAMRYFLVQF